MQGARKKKSKVQNTNIRKPAPPPAPAVAKAKGKRGTGKGRGKLARSLSVKAARKSLTQIKFLVTLMLLNLLEQLLRSPIQQALFEQMLSITGHNASCSGFAPACC